MSERVKNFKSFASLVLSGALVLSLVGVVFAARPNTDTSFSPGNSGNTVSIPENAKEVAPGVYDIGTARDTDGSLVQGYMFIRYKKGFHHKDDHNRGGPNGGGGDDDSTTSSCYSFLSNETKWLSTENYMVDPTNDEGLDEQGVRDILSGAIDEWEAEAGQEIIGEEESYTGDGADTDSPDDKNEVLFGDVDSEGAIAVTIVWGRFNGPPWQRELVEWDQVYDQVDFDWSLTGESTKMDFHNIAQHELGHSVGMGHPDDSCTLETMYAYADNGETIKRNLHDGDKAGVSELY